MTPEAKERKRVQTKAWNQSPKGRAAQKRRNAQPENIERRKQYRQSAAGKAAGVRGTRAWVARNPEKRAAHVKARTLVNQAPEACQGCGAVAEKTLNKHHEDYNKPLEVIYFCDDCHRNAHAS